jgi:nucleoside-diphosphate-sugar epimerase
MKRILITGSAGMLGKAVCKKFESTNVKLIEINRNKVDLRNSNETFNFFSEHKPDLVVHCAALVGGIQANIKGGTRYFLENNTIDTSVLNASRALRVKDLIYIGSSCMYPGSIDYPLSENDFLGGSLEPTNQNYALAKIFGTYLTKSISIQDELNWRVFIASNLYGPNDHFDNEKSHLLAAIISKAIAAKKNKSKYVEMWGDGTPQREFTYVEDFADWILYSSKFLDKLPHILNVGVGVDYTVLDYYRKVLTELDLDIEIIPRITMPNGNRRKLMDSSLAKSLGWNPTTGIEVGIAKTVEWYLNHRSVV